MDLEGILTLGAIVVVGSAVIGPSLVSTLISIDKVFSRSSAKKFAEQLNLVDIYSLNGPEELALHRIGFLKIVIGDITKRELYKDVMIDSFEEYMPKIAEQSGYFKADIAGTDAFREFLNDTRTISWLTDPNYVMTDKQYFLKTNPFKIAY